MQIFYDRDFDRVELRLPYCVGDQHPDDWWAVQGWFAQQGVVSLSNKSAEYDEIRPLPQWVTDYVWWDFIVDTNRWSWYIPKRHKGLAALFKLTWGGK